MKKDGPIKQKKRVTTTSFGDDNDHMSSSGDEANHESSWSDSVDFKVSGKNSNMQKSSMAGSSITKPIGVKKDSVSSFEDSTPGRAIQNDKDSSIHKNSTIPEDKEEDYTTMNVGQAVELANDREGTQSEKMSE